MTGPKSTSNQIRVWESAPKEWQKYDMCLVLPIDVETGMILPDSLVIIRKLAKLLGRKYIYVYYAPDNTKVYVLIRAGLKFLRSKALSEKWELLLDDDIVHLLAQSNKGNEYLVDSLAIQHFTSITQISPFEYIYLPFHSDPNVEKLFRRFGSMKHPFRKIIRLKMLIDFFNHNANSGSQHNLPNQPSPLESFVRTSSGHFSPSNRAHLSLPISTHTRSNDSEHIEFGLKHLLHHGLILNAFAIHDTRDRDEIAAKMLKFTPCLLPLDLIHGYFGEQIAMYFSFLDFLNRWSYFIAMVGIAFEAMAIYYDEYSRPEIPTFSFFMMGYVITMIQFWKREEKINALKWNTMGCSFRDDLLAAHDFRPQFYGVKMKSYVDGTDILYYPSSKRSALYVASSFAMILCIAFVLIAIMATYYARLQVSHTIVAPYEQWVASGITAFQIIICSSMFSLVSWDITEWENHRHDKEFEKSLIIKSLVFEFFNVLTTFYYLGFAARYVPPYNQPDYAKGECGYDNCMFPLVINLVTVVSIEMLWRFFYHFVYRYIRYHILSGCFGHYAERNFENDDESMAPILTTTSYSHNAVPLGASNDDADASTAPGDRVRRNSSESKAPSESPSRPRRLKDRAKSESPRKSRSMERRPSAASIGASTISTVSALSPKKKENKNDNPLQASDNSVNSPSRNSVRSKILRPPSLTIEVDEEEKEQNEKLKEEDIDEEFDEDAENANTERASNLSEFLAQQQSVKVVEGRGRNRLPRRGSRSSRSRASLNQDAEAQTVEHDDSYSHAEEGRSRTGRGLYTRTGGDDDQSTGSRRVRDYAARRNTNPLNADDDGNGFHDEESSTLNPFESYHGISYNHQHEMLYNYSHILRLFLICFCFGSALPGVYALLLIYTWMEIRGHSWNLFYYFPRPLPEISESLGTWLHMFQVVLIIGILTNASLVIFTMEQFKHWETKYQLGLWIGYVLVLGAYHYVLSLYFDDIPEEVIVQKQRSLYIASKITQKAPVREGTIAIEML